MSQDFDAARNQVTQEYEARDNAILLQYGIATDEQKAPVMALVDEMTSIQAEQDEAAADEEEEEIGDEGLNGEAAAATTDVAPAEAAPEVPDYFHNLEVANADAFPVAWAIYLNNQEKDEAIGELDQKEATEKLEGSYVASIGKFIEPVMRPLGFDWKMSVSLVTAFAAKEVMVSTLGTIYSIAADADNEQPLQVYLRQDPSFTPLVAVGLMMFVLIYPPCFAAMAVFKREAGGWGWLGFFVLYSTALAWVAAFIVYNGGHLLGFH